MYRGKLHDAGEGDNEYYKLDSYSLKNIRLLD